MTLNELALITVGSLLGGLGVLAFQWVAPYGKSRYECWQQRRKRPQLEVRSVPEHDDNEPTAYRLTAYPESLTSTNEMTLDGLAEITEQLRTREQFRE